MEEKRIQSLNLLDRIVAIRDCQAQHSTGQGIVLPRFGEDVFADHGMNTVATEDEMSVAFCSVVELHTDHIIRGVDRGDTSGPLRYPVSARSTGEQGEI